MEQNTKKLSVVIVNYNVKDYVAQCLMSVERAVKGIDAEVFVVDNHSKDSSCAYIRKMFPWVKLIESNHNLGFARGNNVAIRRAVGEYVLLLNPDTIVGENVLRDAMMFMDEHPKAGGVGVRMYNDNGTVAPESRRALPSPMVAMRKFMGFSSRYYMSHLPWDSPQRIEIISGAFCMMRHEALYKAGLLDEDFFMYGEDIDMSYRLLKAGYENWYLPLDIIHYKGESTNKSSFRYVHVFYNAMLIFFKKHYSGLSWLMAIPIKIAIYVQALLVMLRMVPRMIAHNIGLEMKRALTPYYIYIGSERMRQVCSEMSLQRALDFCVYDSVDNVVFKKGVANIVVFDTGVYSYSDIITKLEAIGLNNVQLGTYSELLASIITPDEVFYLYSRMS